MKKIYVSTCIEWDENPTITLVVSKNLETLTNEIKSIIAEFSKKENDEKPYFNYTKPEEVFCTKKTFKKIFKKSGKIEHCLIKKSDYKLFKKL